MTSDEQLIEALRARHGDAAVDEWLEKRRRFNEALDANRRRAATRWDKIFEEEKERWRRGEALRAKQERQKSALGQFEEFVIERIPDGFGHVVERVRRAFKPPANF